MNRTAADAIVVGSGAGGAAVAHTLASRGFSVLILEKGPRYERADFVHDEMLARGAQDMFLPSIEDDPHILADHSTDPPTVTPSLVGWTAVCVGGGTTHMGGTLHRLHPKDFTLRSSLGEFYDVVDWPYGYAQLEPFYALAEGLIGVSGCGDGWPSEMFRSKPFPLPPFESHPLALRFDEECRRRGLRPFATPRGINSVPFDGRPACEHCDMCSGVGCPVGARGSAQETLLARAEATGNCVIVPQAAVVRLRVDHTRRVRAVDYIDADGIERTMSAPVVCICCGAIESARLLLLSASRACPEGVANSSGLVGRYLQFHSSSSGYGVFPQPDETPKAAPSAVVNRALMDYYFAPDDRYGYQKGGFISFNLMRRKPLAIAERIALGQGINSTGELVWGQALKRLLKNSVSGQESVEFEVFHDAIPNAGTYVELDGTIKDKFGLPAARINYRPLDLYASVGRWAAERGVELLNAMGAERAGVFSVGVRNPYMPKGTCRAGTDRRSSVVSEFGQSHDIRNLFIVDGSFMPSSGGSPSTLTIVANALRCADYLAASARSQNF